MTLGIVGISEMQKCGLKYVIYIFIDGILCYHFI